MKNLIYIQILDIQNRGYCHINYCDNEYIIHSLNVTRPNRKKKIGTELLHSAEEIISKLGGEYSYLYVREANKWQHDWYKRIGYTDMEAECDSSFIRMKKKLI